MGKIYTQLSIADRTIIQAQLNLGSKPAAIALILNRSASTISRELNETVGFVPKFIPVLAALCCPAVIVLR